MIVCSSAKVILSPQLRTMRGIFTHSPKSLLLLGISHAVERFEVQVPKAGVVVVVVLSVLLEESYYVGAAEGARSCLS